MQPPTGCRSIGPADRRTDEKLMFLIAGVQPKTKRLEENPRQCPACGRVRAYTTRVDHYLSLFFIPLLRVKQGEPFLLCDACQRPVDETTPPRPEQPLSATTITCVACRRTFDGSFNYCPHCGQRA